MLTDSIDLPRPVEVTFNEQYSYKNDDSHTKKIIVFESFYGLSAKFITLLRTIIVKPFRKFSLMVNSVSSYMQMGFKKALNFLTFHVPFFILMKIK